MQEFTGLEYLKMDIAAAFGLDKEIWDVRLAWFEQNRDVITEAPTAQMISFCRTADEPAQAVAGILAYRKVIQGEAIGYMVGLDATASGLQLLALLAGDEKAAAICNLINTGRREDAYKAVHMLVDQIMGAHSEIDRKPVKQALN